MGQGKRVEKEEAGACREKGWQVISERGKRLSLSIHKLLFLTL